MLKVTLQNGADRFSYQPDSICYYSVVLLHSSVCYNNKCADMGGGKMEKNPLYIYAMLN